MTITRLYLPRNREELDAHFAALSAEDLFLRFCSPVSPKYLTGYLDRLEVTGAPLYGIFNFRLELVAVSHFGVPAQPSSDLEVGLSVIETYRRKGLASTLLYRAASYARSRGFKALVFYCVAENTPMLSLARRLGISVAISQDEALGRLKIGAGTILDYWSELSYDQADIVDSAAKRWQSALLPVPAIRLRVPKS